MLMNVGERLDGVDEDEEDDDVSMPSASVSAWMTEMK